MDKRISDYIDAHREEYIADLKRLVNVRSVRGEKREGMPYGEGPANALKKAQEIAGEYGFTLKSIDGHAGEIDLGNSPVLAILAHLDVVEEGDGWTRSPYNATYENGRLYGRGSTDNKGPALASLYALRAVRDIYGTPETGVRLVLGCAEETGSEDMAYYFTKRPCLPMTFSPDADYPLINLEKGHYTPNFGRTWEIDERAPRVISFDGGSTHNIVPCRATAATQGVALSDAQRVCAEFTQKTGVEIRCSSYGSRIVFTADGVSAHASQPQRGNNAQTALLEAINALPLVQNEASRAIAALCRLFPHGDCLGEAAGVKMSDEKSGELTLNFGVLHLNETGFSANFDSRVPLCANDDNLKSVIESAFAREGFEYIGKPKCLPVHYVPEDAPLVKTLLGVFEDYTGQKGECLAIGGGTYVHEIEGGVAFGCEFFGVTHNIHGADEFADVDEMLLSAKMFADAIIRCAWN